ncbi:tetratricopeptide repeat protein [Paludibacterium denitrificans]|uniref:tetratricopeptide repeat protein n=1 Tax=Paludibacterium denitrificans TaxID=2675226 RepID=UPI001E52DBA8|nr:tetratricopeptide repeat protein [Paludibacterium denitrificans]
MDSTTTNHVSHSRSEGCFNHTAAGVFLNKHNYPVAHQITIPEALSQAYAHWNAGQAPQAEQLCLRVLQAVPRQPDALHLLGLIAHAYGQLDLAITHLRRGVFGSHYTGNVQQQSCRNVLKRKGCLQKQKVRHDVQLR